MILPAIALWFRTNPRNWIVIAGLVGTVIVLALAYAKGSSDRGKREEARRVVAEQAALKSDAKADAKATAEQVRAAEARAEKEGKLIDAVSEVPDGLPDAVAVRLGCERLRQAGVSVADLPACKSAG